MQNQDPFAAFLARPRNRFDDALEIQLGASNLVAIAGRLVAAANEARAEGTDWRGDPALQLIVHQMAHLVGVMTVDYPRNAFGGFIYRDADVLCSQRASFETALYMAQQQDRNREAAMREFEKVGLRAA